MSNTTQAPVVLVDTTDDGKAIVTVDGVETHLVAGTVAEVIDQAVQHIASDVATPYGGPVTVWATDPATGTSTLSIDQAGTVTPLADAPIPTAAAVVVDEAPVAVVEAQPEAAAPAAVPAAAPAEPVDEARVISRTPEPTTAPVGSERREARRSFLTQEVIEEPATQGARGVLNKLGLRLPPGEQERIERERTYLVSQHFTGPRTIMFANGKGGAGKTMTTICLAAIFARFGGAGVLAWDNNQTRGTLGWSTEQARHDSSILDLLPHIDRLLGTGAQSADLAQFVHHQTRDRYDVLKSKPDVLASEQRFDDSTVDTIHALATKFYRLVFIDSGNDETDPMWLRAMDRTNQLVVPTTTDDKWAESAALLLEGLTARGGHYAEMSRNAVVVVGAEHAKVTDARLAHIAAGFKGLAREVVTIPYDEGLKASIINYGALQPATQRAWLAAGAAVARGL